jgi:hypothetical protein
VLRNAALEAVVTSQPRDGASLAAIPGLGPRALAKHGDQLLGIVAAYPSEHYLPPTDQGDAEMLERLADDRRG